MHSNGFVSLMLLQGQRQAVTSDAIIHQWVEAYKMQSRLAFAPSALEETKTEAVGHTRHHILSHHLTYPLQASRFLLTSYIGAVYYRYGLSPIKAWIDRLIEPDDPPVHSNPPQPSQLPPAIPQSPQHTHHINPAQGNALAMFNQTLQQNGMTAEWPAESSGPPHALRWSVRCLGRWSPCFRFIVM
jgi:hypothetical protein